MSVTAEDQPKPRRARSRSRSAPRASEPVREVCPFLVGADGGWRSAQPTRDHRCTAVEPAVQPSTGKQRDLCLQPAHFGCATYQAARELSLAGRPVADGERGDLWPETRGVVLALDPVQGRPVLGGVSGRAGGQALLVGLMVVAFLVLAASRFAPAGATDDPQASVAGVVDPGSDVSPSISIAPATEPPTAAPTDVPSASASAMPTPTTAPTARPTAAPDPSPLTYRVKSGDTLSSIAIAHGTTVRALRRANNLPVGTVIRPGQVLVIPE